jgi:hypothetical protein
MTIGAAGFRDSTSPKAQRLFPAVGLSGRMATGGPVG